MDAFFQVVYKPSMNMVYKPSMNMVYKPSMNMVQKPSIQMDQQSVTTYYCRAVKHPALRVFDKCAKSHLCPSSDILLLCYYSAKLVCCGPAAAASYGETIFLALKINGSSLLAEEFHLLPEIRLLQGDEQQTIHKQ
ncbi:hypothetical protein OUZ56_004347 [Daphnia magna]|uniref:Uncharacterized protein n=1 Tax=Daphnia magna TaxID=35525 RepID=A0ABQ9YPI1_9CRUS|nr:hypothetical protein OUZ56_004347 [Daphnia magna]